MKQPCWLAAVLIFLAAACQPDTPGTIVILDGEQRHILAATSARPSDLFLRAGVLLGANDLVLHNGEPISVDRPLPAGNPGVLQLRRAVRVDIETPEGARALETAAWTVGQALVEAGLTLYAADRIEPDITTPISGPITVRYDPATLLTVRGRDGTLEIRSRAATVGAALAQAGRPLMGLDYSEPAADQPLPTDGQIKVLRVSESLILAQKPIAFESEFKASADVPLDQQQVLHPGIPGLSVSRVRIRYEDGQEVSRLAEAETLVRPPQNRVVGYGTKVEVKSVVVDGVKIEYWRAVQMFATAYSPCRSSPDRCYSSTASGKPVRKGVVALRTDLYMAMRGQGLYIPGYGHATVEDACGGCVGKPWIDLGYSDSDYQSWGNWVTVYFLTPVPPSIIYVLE